MGSTRHAQQQDVPTGHYRQDGGALVAVLFHHIVVATVLYHTEPRVLVERLHFTSRPMKRRSRGYMPNQFLRVR